MGVQPGFEDLKPKRVIGIDMIRGSLDCVGEDGKPLTMDLYVGSTGALMARPLEGRPIDQLAPPVQIPRHYGVDQV